MKTLLIVPDGVAVRNYLYSNFISELEKKGSSIVVYHQISDNAILEVERIHKNLKFIKIPTAVESPKLRLLRESLAYARILRNIKILDNKTILSFWSKNKKGIKQKGLYFVAESLGYVLSKSINLLKWVDKLYENTVLKQSVTLKIKKDIINIKPNVILNLHQRAPLSAPIISISNLLNIKTATVIFSWDNVPKARLISRYDYYLVWSTLMKSELLQLYPEISSEQVVITGTPQFDFYFNEKGYLDKKVFFEKYGLDINKKTICFSGNDTSSPYEANYLEDLCEEIQKIKEENRPQILFRRCPVDKSNRFDAILKKYESFIFAVNPIWNIDKENEGFTAVYPKCEDNNLLKNTVKHCDVVVNLGSTMAHDFAILNKPCLYFNYDPVINSKFKVNHIYKFQHFKSMKGLNAVGWINTKEDIQDKILRAIKSPIEIAEDRIKWLNCIAEHRENASKNMTNTLINL